MAERPTVLRLRVPRIVSGVLSELPLDMIGAQPSSVPGIAHDEACLHGCIRTGSSTCRVQRLQLPVSAPSRWRRRIRIPRWSTRRWMPCSPSWKPCTAASVRLSRLPGLNPSAYDIAILPIEVASRVECRLEALRCEIDEPCGRPFAFVAAGWMQIC